MGQPRVAVPWPKRVEIPFQIQGLNVLSQGQALTGCLPILSHLILTTALRSITMAQVCLSSELGS